MATETSDLLNTGEIVEACGQAWTLAHIGPKIRGAFSAWLKSRARKELSEQRRDGILDEDGYRESLAMTNQAMTAGAYNWGSPLSPDGMGSAVQAAIQETDGKVRLVQLLLEPAHGAVSGERLMDLLSDNVEGWSAATTAAMAPNGQAPAKRG